MNAKKVSWNLTALERVVYGIALLTILLAVAARYPESVARSKQAVWKQDRTVVLHAIEDYVIEKKKQPQSIQEMIDAGYLHSIPVNPVTGEEATLEEVTGP